LSSAIIEVSLTRATLGAKLCVNAEYFTCPAKMGIFTITSEQLIVIYQLSRMIFEKEKIIQMQSK
jgi:hypothetical protein